MARGGERWWEIDVTYYVLTDELIRYAATHADTVIIGCSSREEVASNLAVGRRLSPMSPSEQRALEARLAPRAWAYDSFKREE